MWIDNQKVEYPAPLNNNNHDNNREILGITFFKDQKFHSAKIKRNFNMYIYIYTFGVKIIVIKSDLKIPM
jgi:hypothetical protein